MPRIFDYLDYRAFLKDCYAERKRLNPRFSYRYLAGKLGVNAGFLVRALQGERNLSLRHGLGFAELLGLRKDEAEYLEWLILFQSARGHAQRKRYLEKIMERSAEGGSKARRLGADQYEYYEKWYYTAIREWLNVVPFRGDHAALGRALLPPIGAAEARRAVELLARLDLIHKDAQGHYRLRDQFIRSGTAADAVAVRNFQLATLDLAKEALERFPKEERDITTLTLSLSPKGFEAAREKLRECRRALMDIARDDKDLGAVYQLNVQFFPMSKSHQEGNP